MFKKRRGFNFSFLKEGKYRKNKIFYFVFFLCLFFFSSVCFSGSGEVILENPLPNPPPKGEGIEQDGLGGTGTGQTSTGILQDTNFKIIFQNPSYILDKNIEKGTYTCDESKEKCKINFKLVSLKDKDLPTKLSCLIKLSFETGEEQKCNPNTIIFPKGEHSITFKVYEKEKPDNFSEKVLTIKNINSKIETGSGEVSPENPHPSPPPKGEGEEQNGEEKTGTGEITSTGSIDNIGIGQTGTGILQDTNFKIIFQNPSYILDKDIEKGTYICDESKEECKINFKLLSLGDKDLSIKLSCFIDFSFEAGEEQKCNPSTIIFPEGESKIKFRVYEKENIENFSEKILTINKKMKKIISGGGGGGGSSSVAKIRDIIVQSGLEKDDAQNYFCDKKECKVNLKYLNSLSQSCLWDFGESRYREKYLTTCNPGIVYFWEIDNEVKLKVFKNGVFSSEKTIAFKNIWKENLLKNNHKPKAVIKLQGVISKNKSLEGNKIICMNTQKCNINFDGGDSSDPDGQNLDYFWDFGNGENSFKQNPAGIWYEPGKYKIKLRVIDELGLYDESIFLVEVYDNKLGFSLNYNDFVGLKINGVLPNNKGKDDLEYIEIINLGENIINLKGLSLDDKMKAGSKAFLIENDLFLLPNKKRKFFKSETKISLGNKEDEVNIFVSTHILDTLLWDFYVPEEFVITHSSVVNNLIEVKVLRVVDGDTIVVEFSDGILKKLRLIGVDTPETKHPKKKIERFGKEASDFTKKTLEGKKVFIELQSNLDKYGRLLGYVYLEKVDNPHLASPSYQGEEKQTLDTSQLINFNKILIEQGYARAYLRFPFKYSADFKYAEKIAKKNKLGIWSDTEVKKEFLKLGREDKIFFEEDILKQEENLDFTLLKKQETFIRSIFGLKQSENLDLENKVKLSYRIYKQKKSFKISGKTLEDSNILIKIGDKRFILKTNNFGVFSVKLNDLEEGEFRVEFFLIGDFGEEVFLKHSEVKEFTLDYVDSLRKYKNGKTIIQKISKNRGNKISSLKVKNIFFNVSYADSTNEFIEEKNYINFIFLSFLIVMLCLLFSFLVFYKYEII